MLVSFLLDSGEVDFLEDKSLSFETTSETGSVVSEILDFFNFFAFGFLLETSFCFFLFLFSFFFFFDLVANFFFRASANYNWASKNDISNESSEEGSDSETEDSEG